jgi:ketosteroid isomerase-like protein
MSQENVEIVRLGYQALNKGGVEAVLPFLDPDFEMQISPEVGPEPQTVYGHDGVRQWFAAALDVLESIRMEPDELVDAGDRVVAPVRIIATGRGSGIESEQRVTQVWTVRDGRAVRMNAYIDRKAALEAAGLSEQDVAS